VRLFELIDTEEGLLLPDLAAVPDADRSQGRSGYSRVGRTARPPKETEKTRHSPRKIREIHNRSRRISVAARVSMPRALRASGVRCSRKRVARLMRKAGFLQGCRRGPKKRTLPTGTNAPSLPPRPRWPQPRCRSSEIGSLDGGHHLPPYPPGGLFVSRLHPRCLLREGSWLGDGKPCARTELVVDALEMALSAEESPMPGWFTTPTAQVAVHGALIRQEVGGGWDSSFYGKSGIGAGERYIRIVRGEFEMRAPPQAPLSQSGGCQDGCLSTTSKGSTTGRGGTRR
jgi:helix-turn-helix protein